MNTNFMVKRIAWMIVEVRLSSVLRWRDEYGMDYDDVTFASVDGITLDGRYMSTKNPFKKNCYLQSLLACQPLWFSRAFEGLAVLYHLFSSTFFESSVVTFLSTLNLKRIETAFEAVQRVVNCLDVRPSLEKNLGCQFSSFINLKSFTSQRNPKCRLFTNVIWDHRGNVQRIGRKFDVTYVQDSSWSLIG